jgi:hypothetical protein
VVEEAIPVTGRVVEEYNVLGGLRQDVFARPVPEHGRRRGSSSESSATTSDESLVRSDENSATMSDESSVRRGESSVRARR